MANPPKLNILQAGLYRSGTTWQFNAVRVLLEMEYGEEFVTACWIDQFRRRSRREKRPINIVKIHKKAVKAASWSNYIVSTRRDLEGVITSMQKRAAYLKEHPNPDFFRESNINRLEEYLIHATWWRQKACYVQDFDLIEANPLKLITDYAEIFNTTVEPADVLTELKKQLIVPEKGSDPRTFLHEGHITREGLL